MALITLDFETYPIRPKPDYPPKPFAMGIKEGAGPVESYFWDDYGENNNISWDYAKALLQDLIHDDAKFVFHNAAFELAIMEKFFEIDIKKVNFEDTMVHAFLHDPYSKTLALKELGERWLDTPPMAQDVLHDWIHQNVYIDSSGTSCILRPWKGYRRVPRSKAGAYICMAPRHLVQPYMEQDVELTAKLYDYAAPKNMNEGMLPSAKREHSLIPTKIKMEGRGVRLDRERLKEATQVFEDARELLEEQIRRLIKMPPEGNLGSPDQLADALEKSEIVHPDNWVKTSGGKNSKPKRSVSMSNLLVASSNAEFIKNFSMLSAVKKTLDGFMHPWIKLGSRAYPTFHLTRGSYGGYESGAATGRMSSSQPNFQNITNNPEDSRNKEVLLGLQQYLVDNFGYHFWGLRDYIVPDNEMVLFGRDFDGQELRGLAYYENGELANAYRKNKKLDPHEMIKQEVNQKEGLGLERKTIKTVVFCVIYGGGYGIIASELNTGYENAKTIKNAVLDTVPGVRNLNKGLMAMTPNAPMFTIGGRRYYGPMTNDGDYLAYKRLNYIVQGSAADVTKMAMAKIAATMPNSQLLAIVHDEFLMQTYRDRWEEEMAKLEKAMYMEFDGIPFTSSGKWSDRSWARMKKVVI